MQLLRSRRFAGCLRTTVTAAVAMAGGCATVDPTPDLQEAAATIRNRLEIDGVYEPGADELAAQKIDALLDNGLTIEEAVEVALLGNRSFQALFQSIGASRADVVQSGLLSNPSLVLGARFPEGHARPELTLGIAQQLVDLWQIPIRRRVADEELKRTVNMVLDEAVRIAGDTQARYLDLAWRQDAAALARGNLEVADQSAAVAEARLRAGDASPLDAGLVRARANQARDDVWIAERESTLARLELARIMGLARDTRTWMLAAGPWSPPGIGADETELLACAMDQRFDVRIAGARVRAAAERVRLQWLQVFPNVTIGVNAERTEQRSQPARNLLADTARASVAAGQLTAPTIQSRGQREIARNDIIDALFGPSMQLTLPIWDQNQAQIAKARFEAVRALKEEDALLDAVATELRRAAAAARIARQRVQYFEATTLRQVEANLQSARSLFEDGGESVIVLLEAQTEAFRVRRAALDARRELALATTELQRAVGGRLPRPASQSPTSKPADSATASTMELLPAGRTNP